MLYDLKDALSRRHPECIPILRYGLRLITANEREEDGDDLAHLELMAVFKPDDVRIQSELQACYQECLAITSDAHEKQWLAIKF